MYRTLSAPVNLQIELTESCTHSCRHCYNFFRHSNSTSNHLKKNDLMHLARDIVDLKISRIVLTGGEPLLELEKLLWIANELSRVPWISVSLNSNLVLLDATSVREIKESGVHTLLTSLISDEEQVHDWVTQRKGSWKKTVDSIVLAKKHGIRVLVNMVLTKWNVGRVYQTGKFVDTLGIDKFGATRACAPTPLVSTFKDNLISVDELRMSIRTLYRLKDECGYEIDVFEHYPWCALGDVDKYSYLARRKCSAGITAATVGANGQLRPCGHSNRQYGSVIENGISHVWKKMDDWRKMSYVGTCKTCKYLLYCSGGCVVEAENSGHCKDHHCVGESGVISLPKKKKTTVTVGTEEQVCFPCHVYLRKETFGGILCSGHGGLVLLNGKSFDAVQHLSQKVFFTANEVSKVTGYELQKVTETLSDWRKKNLLSRR